MSNKRDKFEIIADILKKAKNEAGKTKIMYGANLNHSRVSKYLDLLRNKGFIIGVKEGSQTKYIATEKGEGFLKRFKELKKEFDESKPRKKERDF